MTNTEAEGMTSGITRRSPKENSGEFMFDFFPNDRRKCLGKEQAKRQFGLNP
jgi:hypothetical protein